jgi:hypothetical protein
VDCSSQPQGELIHITQYSLNHGLGIVLVDKAFTLSLSPVAFCVSKKILDVFYAGVKHVL